MLPGWILEGVIFPGSRQARFFGGGKEEEKRVIGAKTMIWGRIWREGCVSGGNGHCDEDLLKAFLDDRSSFTAVRSSSIYSTTIKTVWSEFWTPCMFQLNFAKYGIISIYFNNKHNNSSWAKEVCDDHLWAAGQCGEIWRGSALSRKRAEEAPAFAKRWEGDQV